MRDGVLLAEENPTLLLAKYNSDDLEDVFLRLSLQQNELKTEVGISYATNLLATYS